MSITGEAAFEANIEAHLLAHGWHSLAPAAYDRKAGVFGVKPMDQFCSIWIIYDPY